MDFAREILVLQEERQKCILNMNFARAKEIEVSISLLKAGSDNANWIEKSSTNHMNFEKEKQATLNELMQDTGIRIRAIYQIRAKHQRDLVEVQSRQASEMAKLTSEFAKEIELYANRPIPQVSILERDARSHAQRSNYAMAECLAREAKQLKAETIRLAHAEIHAKYVDKQEKMIAKHRSFLDSFNSKLESDIENVHLDHENHIGSVKRRLKLLAVKYKQELTDEKVEELVSQYRTIDDDLMVVPEAQKSKTRARVKTPTRKVKVQQ